MRLNIEKLGDRDKTWYVCIFQPGEGRDLTLIKKEEDKDGVSWLEDDSEEPEPLSFDDASAMAIEYANHVNEVQWSRDRVYLVNSDGSTLEVGPTV